MDKSGDSTYYIINKFGRVVEIRKILGDKYLVEKATSITNVKFLLRWVNKSEFWNLPLGCTAQLVVD